MELIEEVFGSVSDEKLERMDICYRCVAAGLPIESCVQDERNMEFSPETGDTICSHCLMTEEQSGMGDPMPPDLAEAVWGAVKQFNDYKRKRIYKNTF